MVLTPEDKAALTEGKYWKPEIGKKHTIVLSNWRRENRSYMNDPKNEPKPYLVFDLTSIDGVLIGVKEFSTSNRALNSMLFDFIEQAERTDQAFFKVTIRRLDKNTYSVSPGGE